MNELMQFRLFRRLTLNALSEIKEDKWDILPGGHQNTIRWNAGHLYIAAEMLMNKADHQYKIQHSNWRILFAPGTRPSGWAEKPPTTQEIINALKEQRERIPEFFSDKLQNKASDPFVIGKNNNMNTVELLVQFVLFHEGIHAGTIKTLNNTIKDA